MSEQPKRFLGHEVGEIMLAETVRVHRDKELSVDPMENTPHKVSVAVEERRTTYEVFIAGHAVAFKLASGSPPVISVRRSMPLVNGGVESVVAHYIFEDHHVSITPTPEGDGWTIMDEYGPNFRAEFSGDIHKAIQTFQEWCADLGGARERKEE